MVCPTCRADTPAGATFCSQCGTSLVPPNAAVSPAAGQFYQPAATRLSGFALAALLICGLCFLSVLGIVFGIVALVQTASPQNRLQVRGLAIAGLIVSCIFFFTLPAILFPVFARSPFKGNIDYLHQ